MDNINTDNKITKEMIHAHWYLTRFSKLDENGHEHDPLSKVIRNVIEKIK